MARLAENRLLEAPASCRYLDWDSEFFGARIARFEDNRLTPDTAARALAWCRENRIECLYLLTDATHAETSIIADQAGFRLVDVRMTLARELNDGVFPNAPPGAEIRAASARDVPELAAIARVSHRDSRFYFDPGFEHSRCDDLYATWIERSCEGYADAVFVAEMDGIVSGYITCRVSNSGEGSIQLLAVHSGARRLGLGRRLVGKSLEYFHERGMTAASVVTQGRNIASQKLYQRCGFRTNNMQFWFHRWFR
jgi:dTDP-4-amino-4,6-dideoxy-D-galactose acyltransferase